VPYILPFSLTWFYPNGKVFADKFMDIALQEITNKGLLKWKIQK
jgi:hypothetical protein